jgi:ATP-binding protein involved in chromosome partitioning
MGFQRPGTQHSSRRSLPAGVRNIVLVMSGKGGVGKSTVADEPHDGPRTRSGCRGSACSTRTCMVRACPRCFGVMGRPDSADGKTFLPLERFGVKLMSHRLLARRSEERGRVARADDPEARCMQFLNDVEWGTLDYLVLDLPPGTGDIALTISQKVRTTGAVIVTTPQEVALQDVYKSVSMAQKVGIPILGVIENESYFVCDGCDKRHTLFGSGGGLKIAEFAGAPLIGQIPLDPSVREWGDAGTPVVQAAPESAIGRAFIQVARELAAKVSVHNLSRGGSLRIDRTGGQQRFLPIVR